MLDANGDCSKCAGDCPQGNCMRTLKQVCGQGIEGRGCGTQHQLHELFCNKAKCFNSVSLHNQMELAGVKNNPWGWSKGAVLLQIMYIPALKTKNEAEVVLWDTGTDTNYVQLAHAQKQKFPFKMETVMVMTVGNQVERKVLPVYRCQIKDLHDRILTFFALALPKITGEMYCPLTGEQL